MERIFGRPIVTQEEMRARIKELGKQIANDYTGKDLVLVGVLKGAYAFYADLGAGYSNSDAGGFFDRHELWRAIQDLGKGESDHRADRGHQRKGRPAG